MIKWIKMVSSIATCVLWGMQALWAASVGVLWVTSRSQTSIDQCSLAAQACGLMIAGYVVTRGLTSALASLERCIGEGVGK